MRSVIVIGLCAAFSVSNSLGQMPRTVAVGGSYIGVMMQEVDSDRAKALKLGEETGVEITLVEPDGPAEKAGLKVADVVLRYNGQRVDGMEQFARMIRETPAGREAKIDISRAGAMQTVIVRVSQRKTPHIEFGDQLQMPNQLDLRMPELPRNVMPSRASILGVEAESIDGQLAQYFGVREGVLVRSVLKGSAAEKAGIRAGDVIEKLEDTHVASPADISASLRTTHSKSIPIVLMRDHKELTVTVTVSDADPSKIQFTPFQVHPNQP
jgi:serine protease Do